MELQQRFSTLLSNYTEDKNLIASLWNDVYTNYTEKHRAYHNLQHLTEIFSYFDLYKHELNQPNIVAISIFYHDVIYKVWNKENEEKSADFAFRKLNTVLNNTQLNEIQQQILATKNHSTQNNDTKWLVDFDLAILGQPPETYKKYTTQIRNEYKTVPNFIYKKGRKKVLLHFKKKSYIFATDKFRNLYEKIAKENLNNELKLL